MTKQEILDTHDGKIDGQIFELKVENIFWETDAQDVDLPSMLDLDIDDFDYDFDFDEELADWLSDKYGWLVDSYEFSWDTLYTN